ncbi:hypothetical protein S245_037480, partial [Arachis hypogaea]
CSNNSCRVAYHPLCARAGACGVGFATVGVNPTVMGVGLAFAIPVAVKSAGLEPCDIALFEINEAFASQFVYSFKKLGLDRYKVNVNGGAIALGILWALQVMVVDVEAYTYNDEVIKKTEVMGKSGLVEINAKQDSFIFTVETTRAIKASKAEVG